MEVIVVDNASSDGSREYLEPAFPEVAFYWNNKNLGFAKACNIGLKQAKGTYILFLNPDTIVGEDCFEKCIDFLRSHTQSGVLGVRMIDESGRFLKRKQRAFPLRQPPSLNSVDWRRYFPNPVSLRDIISVTQMKTGYMK